MKLKSLKIKNFTTRPILAIFSAVLLAALAMTFEKYALQKFSFPVFSCLVFFGGSALSYLLFLILRKPIWKAFL